MHLPFFDSQGYSGQVILVFSLLCLIIEKSISHLQNYWHRWSSVPAKSYHSNSVSVETNTGNWQKISRIDVVMK